MNPIALALSLTALQGSQGALPDPNYSTFQNVITQLSYQPLLFLRLNGSVSYKGKTTSLISNLYWSNTANDNTQNLRVELETFSNGVLVKRLVGDGQTLWSYDLLLRQYSATTYGGTPGYARPDTYCADLLNHLNWASSGQDAYLTKLLKQVYNTANPTYASWMPGIPSIWLPQNIQYSDPINPQMTYLSVPGDDFYIYNGSPKRSIVFEITGSSSGNSGGQPASGLKTIYFNQAESVSKSTRFTQWQITPYTGQTFSEENFKPYSGRQIQGWRPVVTPKPVN